MIPIKNSIIGLIIILNAIGIAINYFLLYMISDISNNSSKNDINGTKYLLMILHIICIYFTFTIIFTFNCNDCQRNQEIHENQINQPNQQNQRNQRNDNHNNGGGLIGPINCEGGGGDCAPLLLLIALICAVVLVVVILVNVYHDLGKKNTTYCSLLFLSIFYTLISIICFGLVDFLNFYIIGGICSCLTIFNVLIIIILNCRIRQRNNDLENNEIKDPILMTENGTNNILVTNKSVTTPIYNQEDNSKMNDIEKPIESINAIDVYERNNEKNDQCFDEKNELLNKQNDQVSQTPISRVSDLSNAPLPNNVELPTEEEIYKNYSNL